MQEEPAAGLSLTSINSLLCRELDAIEDHSKRLELLFRGVFAGNVFDLGAATSADLFKSKGVSAWALCFSH